MGASWLLAARVDIGIFNNSKRTSSKWESKLPFPVIYFFSDQKFIKKTIFITDNLVHGTFPICRSFHPPLPFSHVTRSRSWAIILRDSTLGGTFGLRPLARRSYTNLFRL